MKYRLIYGGSFDPIHLGHKLLLEKVYQYFNVDVTHLVIARKALLKDDYYHSYNHRYRMCQIAFRGYKNLVIEDSDYIYTIDVIKDLKSKHPNDKFYLLMGTDQINQFDKWKSYQDILSLVTLIEVKRDHYISKNFGQRILNFQHPASSSKIRNGDFQYLETEVLNYIYKHNLYYQKYLKTHLSTFRYLHSVSTAYFAKSLARIHKLDQDLAFKTGLLHDMAKELRTEEMENIMRVNFPNLKKYPYPVFHSFAASHLVKQQLRIDNPLIIDAIYHHTLATGCGVYDKLIFLADKLEYGRKLKYPFLRSLAFKDIDQCFNFIIDKFSKGEKI